MAEPRHRVLPDGIVSTGWPSVRDTCAQVGITFDPWQQEFNRALLAKRADGLYAADTAGLSICRQAGKTHDIGGVAFADCLVEPDTTIGWTAHAFKVARETFVEMKAMADRPAMRDHIANVTTGAGNESIHFENGSRVLFAARERGSVRGFARVRRLVCDEAQILTERAMSDLVPTMNTAPNPQIVLMGTPPKPGDPSEVFAGLRADALAGQAEATLWWEYGADPDANPDDWAAVASANPSFPHRTGRRAILRLRKLLSTDDYLREGLGIWAPAKTDPRAIAPETWAALADPASSPAGQVAFAVDMPPDRRSAVLAVAGTRDDGRHHVEVIRHEPGSAWVAEYLKDLQDAHEHATVALDPAGPAGALLPDLERHEVDVRHIVGREYAQACGALDLAIRSGTLRHLGLAEQPPLTAAVAAARRRKYGDAFTWARVSVETDISPLVAATLALHAHRTADPRSRKKRRPKTGRGQFV